MTQCPFYKWGQGHIYGPSVCVINDKRVTPKQIRHHCKAPCSNYQKCPHYIKEISNNNLFKVIIEYATSIKNYDINQKVILNELKEYRIKVLDKKEECRDLLVYYDRMNKIIIDAIKNTRIETIDEFLITIYENYILNIYNFILKKDTKQVISIYQEMFDLLIVQFSLNHELANIRDKYKHPGKYGRYALVKNKKIA